MLDFSLGEIGLICVVALLALGPERLPRAARTVGALARRARSTWQSVRDDIEAEFASGELTRSVERIGADLRREIDPPAADPVPPAAESAASSRLPDAAHVFKGIDTVPPTQIRAIRTQRAPNER